MSSITDKLTLANDNVPKTYMAGKSCKDMTDFSYYFYYGARSDMIDCINTCCGTNFTEMFGNWSELGSIADEGPEVPLIDTSKGTNFRGMFTDCDHITTIPQLDVSNGTIFTNMFYHCTELLEIPQLNTSKGKKFDGMFSDCWFLTTTPQLDVSNGTNFVSMFDACYDLEDITFLGSIPTSISFSDCTKLTLESLQSIVNALAINQSSTKPTLTLSSESWATLDNATPPDGYTSWKEYITNYKNWLYA